MPSLKDIRTRISSVKNTQKITKAMKMVAAAKLRRAQESIINTRPYAHRIDGLIKGLTEVLDEYMHPLMIEREEVKNIALLVITSDKGMCGAFNSSILKATSLALGERFSGHNVKLYLVGRKAMEYFKRRDGEIEDTFPEVYLQGRSQFEEADNISHKLVRDFNEANIDEVWVVYNEFKSVIAQNLTFEKLVPITPNENTDSKATHTTHEYDYEPDRKDILNALVPQHLSIQLYRCLLESQASEHGARMTAMEGATKNAGEMIDKLTMQFNRARQAAITTELMEIISGAEALKG